MKVEKKYKRCRNDVYNNILLCSKRKYYHDRFESVQNNLKKTWSIINEVLGRKNTAVNKPTVFMYKGSALSEQQEIDVGSNVLKDHSLYDNDFSCYMPNWLFLNQLLC